MSKILGVSDIHINDYSTRNPKGDSEYRLHQSRIVAQNIIKVGKSKGCDYIAIAGDVIEKSMNKPKVLYEISLFLNTVMREFKEGWIIWGNHDMENKSSNQEFMDSCLSVILPDNLHYAHQKTVTIDGCVIGFNNWQPEFDLSWIQGKVDVLFTHATICYSGDSGIIKSQELDDSKFDIAFCGDIHKPGEIGKYVSIGIPQRCKMSDGEICSGIVLDCANHSWERVNLNPDDNLMKFEYTTIQEEEGWYEDLGLYKVYKRDISTMTDPNTGLSMSEWDKIEKLINDSITNSGLSGVHSTVLSNIKPDQESQELDMNFSLVRLYCKNWRSIEEAEINFDKGDRILMVGENGSGKTSLISALKYGFCGTTNSNLTSLNPFIQFGTKKCTTEVEFFYQQNKYKIRRSSSTNAKDYGLWINDEPQKYNNKKAFEQDCERRFPFISYMDVLIHEQDKNQFIGSNSGERLAEIITKAFKLDKIDIYNETATNMLQMLKNECSTREASINEANKIIQFIDSKLSSIVLPAYSKDELTKRKQEGILMQQKNKAWNQYLSENSRNQAIIDKLREDIAGLEKTISNYRDINIINQEISQAQQETQRLQARLTELGSVFQILPMKERELQTIIQNGKKCRAEFDSINPEQETVCRTCGQVIKPRPETVAALTNKKRELELELNGLMENYKQINSEVENLRQQKDNIDEEYKMINQNIQQVNLTVSKLMTERNLQETTKNNLQSLIIKLNEMTKLISNVSIPEKVELPDGFMQTMSEIESGILIWNTYESNIKDKIAAENSILSVKQEMSDMLNYMDKLNTYIKLTGPTGYIYKEIMEKLTSQFNDNYVKYEVTLKEFAKKKPRLTLIPQYCNGDNWVSYEACSGGQKTILDIHFLSKILPCAGLFILDEFMKSLDSAKHDLCLEMISEMKIGVIMISSHMESIQAFNNKTCKLTLNDSGITNIDYK